MYVALSRLTVQPEYINELIVAFRARAHLVDQFDGYLGLEVWQSDRDPGEVLMLSRWRDRACFTTYMRSPEHQVSHARTDPALQAAVRLDRLEHLHGYDVVAE